MLPKENRLTSKKDFEKVLKSGEVKQTSSFGLASLSDGGNASRFGIIISNKISKRAVDRNRVRRILRQAIRENLEKIPKGRLFVILARRNILEKSRNEIQKEVERVFARI